MVSWRPKRIGGGAYDYERNPNLEIVNWSGSKDDAVGARNDTHLTVDFGCVIHEDKAGNHPKEGREASNGIYL